MKLGLEALKERAGAVASEELLASITGGRENACHDQKEPPALTDDFGTLVDNIIKLIFP